MMHSVLNLFFRNWNAFIISALLLSVSPVYSSYFQNCDLSAEILENPQTADEERVDAFSLTHLFLRIRIIPRNSCGADDSQFIRLDDIPVRELSFFKKGKKIKVHYSYSSFDPLPNQSINEIIIWKFTGFAE